jgi:hypothetical protein
MNTLIAWAPNPVEFGLAVALVLIAGGVSAVVTSRKK